MSVFSCNKGNFLNEHFYFKTNGQPFGILRIVTIAGTYSHHLRQEVEGRASSLQKINVTFHEVIGIGEEAP